LCQAGWGILERRRRRRRGMNVEDNRGCLGSSGDESEEEEGFLPVQEEKSPRGALCHRNWREIPTPSLLSNLPNL